MLPSSSHQVVCAYPPSYTGGDSVSSHIDAAPPYHQSPYPPSQNDRWMAERDHNYYNRRIDRRSMPSNFPHVHSHRPAHHSSFSHGFGTPSDVPTFQAAYARPHEIQHPVSSWESWDMHPDPNFSMGHIRRFDEKASSWVEPVPPQIPSMVPQQFNNLMMPTENTHTPSPSLYTPPEHSIPLDGFNFPHRLSPLPSPTPSPVQEDVKPNIALVPSNSQQNRRKTGDASESGKSCSHCHATSTPLWRRDPSTMKPLCNACGLYLQQRNKLRPQELIDADDDGSSSEESDANYLGPECSHCRTHRTSVWRRSKSGDQLCNACGVYARLRGKPRPLSLKKNKIRPRSKHSAK